MKVRVLGTLAGLLILTAKLALAQPGCTAQNTLWDPMQKKYVCCGEGFSCITCPAEY